MSSTSTSLASSSDTIPRVAVDARSDRPSTKSGPYLAAVLVVVALVWIPLFVIRVHAHQANVDDYAYADLSRSLTQAANPISAILNTGQNAPLVPVLAMPGVVAFGVYGALGVQLPILLALAFGAFVLSRQWLSPFGAAVTSLAVALNSAVLGYSVMLHFALAATATTIWCFACYMRSDRLRIWSWSIAFGLSFALLALSRTVAPVYAVPMVVVVAVDIAFGAFRRGRRPGWPAFAAIGTALVVAGPWWLVSGGRALHYLTYAGYQKSSGYATRGLVLTPASVYDRAKFELSNLSWGEADLLCILVVVSLLLLLFMKHARRLAQLWLLVAWVVLALLLLSSSSNDGTAFGLPLIAATIVFCGAVLGNVVPFGRLVLPLTLLTLLAAGGASQFTTATSPWWSAPPYRLDVVAGGGSARTNVDQLTDHVAQALGAGTALIASNSPTVNYNGLSWYESTHTLALSPQGPETTAQLISELPKTHSLVTGATPAPFNIFANDIAVEKAAIRDGFRPTQFWSVSKDANIIVWHRTSGHLRAAQLAATAWITTPRNGSKITGTHYLVGDASDPLGISKFAFVVSGGSLPHPVEIDAGPFLFGFVSDLNVDTLADGTYTIRATAEDLAGNVSYSQPVRITVVNHAG